MCWERVEDSCRAWGGSIRQRRLQVTADHMQPLPPHTPPHTPLQLVRTGWCPPTPPPPLRTPNLQFRRNHRLVQESRQLPSAVLVFRREWRLPASPNTSQLDSGLLPLRLSRVLAPLPPQLSWFCCLEPPLVVLLSSAGCKQGLTCVFARRLNVRAAGDHILFLPLKSSFLGLITLEFPIFGCDKLLQTPLGGNEVSKVSVGVI